jgi:hypothetical protein
MRRSTFLLKTFLAGIAYIGFVCATTPAFAQHGGGGGHMGGGGGFHGGGGGFHGGGGGFHGGGGGFHGGGGGFQGRGMSNGGAFHGGSNVGRSPGMGRVAPAAHNFNGAHNFAGAGRSTAGRSLGNSASVSRSWGRSATTAHAAVADGHWHTFGSTAWHGGAWNTAVVHGVGCCVSTFGFGFGFGVGFGFGFGFGGWGFGWGVPWVPFWYWPSYSYYSPWWGYPPPPSFVTPIPTSTDADQPPN